MCSAPHRRCQLIGLFCGGSFGYRSLLTYFVVHCSADRGSARNGAVFGATSAVRKCSRWTLCCSVLQYVLQSVLQNVLQCVAVCCSVLQQVDAVLQCVAICVAECAAECVAVCCSVLQCAAVRCRFGATSTVRKCSRWTLCCSVLQCVLQSVLQNVLQCVAVRCSVLQCAAVRCSV